MHFDARYIFDHFRSEVFAVIGHPVEWLSVLYRNYFVWVELLANGIVLMSYDMALFHEGLVSKDFDATSRSMNDVWAIIRSGEFDGLVPNKKRKSECVCGQ